MLVHLFFTISIETFTYQNIHFNIDFFKTLENDRKMFTADQFGN